MSFAVVSHVNWNDVQGKFFNTEAEAHDYWKSLTFSQSHLLINSLGEELKYWGLRPNRQGCEEMQKWWATNHLAHLDLELHITSVGGASWTLRSDRNWVVQDVKGKLEVLSGVPVRAQQLVHKSNVLSNLTKLREIGQNEDSILQLTLVRRPPEQAAWLDKVQADPSKLAEAPADIRADAEIVMAAASKDCDLYFLAAPSVLSDADFVYGAIRQRGGPEASELSAAPLAWVQTAADAKLALRASFHLQSPDMAAKVFDLPAFTNAADEYRALLVAEPYITQEVSRTLLQGLPRHVLRKAMQRSTLDNLTIGILLLDLEVAAPEGTGLVRGLQMLFSKGKPKTLILEGELLEPQQYAMELFLRHAEYLQALDGAQQFDSLLRHLDDMVPPGRDSCCLLVRACLQHAKNEQAERFFVAGADDSDDCTLLLTEARLPLTVLQKHKLRGKLLAKVLVSYGGPVEVLDAIRQNRDSLKSLIRRTEGDAIIGRSVELSEAFQLAIHQNEEPTGRLLLRAFARPSPQMLPDFEVPLLWLQELRDIDGCNTVVLNRLLNILEATGDNELPDLVHTCWTVSDWSSSTLEQMSRALDLINRWGVHIRLFIGELGGREGEQRRLEAEDQLTRALQALPLACLEDPAVLCRPGMPPHALTVAAFQRARQAEERAKLAEDKARRAETNARQLEEVLEQSRRETSQHSAELQRQIDRLESKIKSLENTVRQS